MLPGNNMVLVMEIKKIRTIAVADCNYMEE